MNKQDKDKVHFCKVICHYFTSRHGSLKNKKKRFIFYNYKKILRNYWRSMQFYHFMQNVA